MLYGPTAIQFWRCKPAKAVHENISTYNNASSTAKTRCNALVMGLARSAKMPFRLNPALMLTDIYIVISLEISYRPPVS